MEQIEVYLESDMWVGGGQVGGTCHLEQVEPGGKREEMKENCKVLFLPLVSVSLGQLVHASPSGKSPAIGQFPDNGRCYQDNTKGLLGEQLMKAVAG